MCLLFQNHLAGCRFRPVECQFKSHGCQEVLTPDHAVEHQARCQYRPVPCEHCHQSVLAKDLAVSDIVIIYRVRKKNNPLAKCQYFGQNSIFWLDFLGVCRGDILPSNLQIWF